LNTDETGLLSAGRLWVLLLAVMLSGIAAAGERDITVGVLAHRGDEPALKMWGPTVDYIESRIPDYNFRLVPLDLHSLPAALERNGLDFILTNPGNYVALEAKYGITRIATLKNSRLGKSLETFGAVIITRADRDDIRTLGDLRGKRFAAVDEGAFGGFQMAWLELREAGIDPFRDFRELRFTGFPQDDIVFAVRDGRIDAGTVRTDVLEGLAGQGAIDSADFRVLNPRVTDDFPFLHSTRLYPEWAFAKARRTPEALASEVAVALLQMPADHPAVRAGEYAGWTVPLSYQPVHRLFRALEIGPYARSGHVTLDEVVREYWYWLAGMLAVILFSLSFNILVKRQVKARTAQLSGTNRALQSEIAERKRAEEESRALLRENRTLIQKSLALQESERRHLARELHDELGQCITAVQADAEIIRERAADCDSRLVASALAIHDVSARLYAMVHSMMQRLRPPMLDDLGLVEALRVEIEAWCARQPDTVFSLEIGDGLNTLGERYNMTIYRIVQECLTNIAKHAAARHVSIRLSRTGPTAGRGDAHPLRLEVSDDGSGFDPAVQRRGLGLIGMRERVEGLDGSLQVASSPGAGTTVTVILPPAAGLAESA
jgi:two-component system sensor histidine kinase TtrS